MPLLDKYPAKLREDLEMIATGESDALFDINKMRRHLEREELELQEELAKVRGVRRRFVGSIPLFSWQAFPSTPFS